MAAEADAGLVTLRATIDVTLAERDDGANLEALLT